MGVCADFLRYFTLVALCGLVTSVEQPATSGAAPAANAPRQFFGQPGVYDPRFRTYPSAYSTYSGYGSRYASYPQTYQPRYSYGSPYNNFGQFSRPYTYATASAPYAPATTPFTTATAPVTTTATIPATTSVVTPATTATVTPASDHTPLTADTCPPKIDPTAGMEGLSPQEQAAELQKQKISAEQLCHLARSACKCARVSACGWSEACGCVPKDLATPGAECATCPEADTCAAKPETAPIVPTAPTSLSCPPKIDPTAGMEGLSLQEQVAELQKTDIKPEQFCHLAGDACKCGRADLVKTCGWSPTCGCVDKKLASPSGVCQACPAADVCAAGGAVVQQPSAVSLQEQQEKAEQEARMKQLKMLTDVMGNKGGRRGRSRGSNDKETRLLKLIAQVKEDEANGGALGGIGSSILPLALMGADDDSSDDGNLFGGSKGMLWTMMAGRG